jgi:signal transduction histidine kinase
MAPGVFAFVVPLVIAGFVLSGRATLLLFAVQAIHVICLEQLQAHSLLPAPAYDQPLINRAVIVLVISGSISSMVFWAKKRLDAARVALEREVTERRSAEQEVRLLNQELEDRVKARTADLDAFTAMVAHDLRSPVITIRGYADLLRENEESLDEEAKFYLSRLSNSAKNMGELIDSLLEFSRRQRIGVSFEELDLTELVEGVRHDYVESGAIDSSWIQIATLPPASTDATLIRQVWTNLLDNAVKFSKMRGVPEVRVFAETVQGTTWYVVQDNGIGFEPEAASQIFEEFERVHPELEVSGSGIGLATVKRIIERLGGKSRQRAFQTKGLVSLSPSPQGNPLGLRKILLLGVVSPSKVLVKTYDPELMSGLNCGL